MATLILKLDIDPITKKKNVWVKYESDGDALPHEHEEEHKRLVDKLLADGTIKPDELGTIRIEREGQVTVLRDGGEATPSAEPIAVKRS